MNTWTILAGPWHHHHPPEGGFYRGTSRASACSYCQINAKAGRTGSDCAGVTRQHRRAGRAASNRQSILDLCMWRRFPSRKAQFCTEELKRYMAVAFQIDLIDAGHQVLSWQGVRRDESLIAVTPRRSSVLAWNLDIPAYR